MSRASCVSAKDPHRVADEQRVAIDTVQDQRGQAGGQAPPEPVDPQTLPCSGVLPGRAFPPLAAHGDSPAWHRGLLTSGRASDPYAQPDVVPQLVHL